MNVIDSLLNYFGYVRLDEKINQSEKPKPSALAPDDEFTSTQPNVDYWTRKIQQTLYVDDTDKIRYDELNNMDNEVPEISAALDANADFIVYPNDVDKSKMVRVSSTNKKAQDKIDEVERRVNVQEKLYPMIRSMLKYGDNAEELVVSMDGKRFLGFRNIPIRTLVPVMIDGFPSTHPRIHQVIGGRIQASLDTNSVFHLCNNTDRERYCKYGKGVSMVEHSRLLYRQLRLMEEGMMISRLSRANQNYAMIVDVGELQGEEALTFLDTYKKRVMRRKYIDPRTGKFSWEYNPLSVIEDIMVPTRAGSGGNVIPLNKNNSTGNDIKDIYYCQDKLIYSTGTPKILIGKEIDINSKSTSDNQMGTFLRRIRRTQTTITPDVKILYWNILRIEGVIISPDELEVHWPLSLIIDEEVKMRIERIKCEIAKMLKVDLDIVDDKFIYIRVLGMSDAEADEMIARMNIEREERAKDVIVPPVDQEDPDDNEDEYVPTKEELIQVVRNKLNDDEYRDWEKIQGMIQKHPNVGEAVIDLINILQA